MPLPNPLPPDPPFPLAERLAGIQPFYVMELIKQADRLVAAGRSIIHLSIGEPDFTAPPPVLAALAEAMAAGRSGYTAAVGLPALREAISTHYRAVYGLDIAAERIVVTAGASGALLLAVAVLLDAGQEVLMPDPSYPCNRHIVAAFNARAKLIAAGPEKRFQLDAGDVEEHWGVATRGVLLASPSNPTGTSIARQQLAEVLAAVRRKAGFLIVDEIYQGLWYGGADQHAPPSALALGDDVIVVNSFSKYFSMTGWRLGWLVVPPALVPAVEKVAQNLFICASAPAQQAALACFTPPAQVIYESRRQEFQARRDYLVPALRELGFEIPVLPDGAFYVYAKVTPFGLPSDVLAHRLLHEAGVCCVPGRDFGENAPADWMRFSYATSLANLQEAVRRMRVVLAALRC
ncbi:MAG TPA: pyridoxal phosphate-dependent aminotransferase [Rhodocyclaceae bacterium]|nr:pyridoxal phosphate-dependent aminotransferase [Rhodocyclaceae bacterium]